MTNDRWMERPHFTTSGRGRHNGGGGGDGRPNNGWEVWHRRRTTASLSRRHTGSERRTSARPKVNSIRKIYYFYNSQISLNERSFSTRPSSHIFSIYVSHPASARGYREKTPVAPTAALPVCLRYIIILIYCYGFIYFLWVINKCDGFLRPRGDITLNISEVFKLCTVALRVDLNICQEYTRGTEEEQKL